MNRKAVSGLMLTLLLLGMLTLASGIQAVKTKEAEGESLFFDDLECLHATKDIIWGQP